MPGPHPQDHSQTIGSGRLPALNKGYVAIVISLGELGLLEADDICIHADKRSLLLTEKFIIRFWHPENSAIVILQDGILGCPSSLEAAHLLLGSPRAL